MLRELRRSEIGAAAIELAIALPVLVLLAIGAADFGRMFFTGIAVANAARTAAEYGAQSPTVWDTSAVNQAGRDDAADVGGVEVTSERFCRCPDGSEPDCVTGACTAPYTLPEVFVTSRAVKTINLIISYPGIPQTLTFRDSATFRAQ
jgi:hypothetical protein